MTWRGRDSININDTEVRLAFRMQTPDVVPAAININGQLTGHP